MNPHAKQSRTIAMGSNGMTVELGPERQHIISHESIEIRSITPADQVPLARFLATVMSAETCRKVVVACGVAGFLAREKSPYGTMLISSRGSLERILGECIRDARKRAEREGDA